MCNKEVETRQVTTVIYSLLQRNQFVSNHLTLLQKRVARIQRVSVKAATNQPYRQQFSTIKTWRKFILVPLHTGHPASPVSAPVSCSICTEFGQAECGAGDGSARMSYMEVRVDAKQNNSSPSGKLVIYLPRHSLCKVVPCYLRVIVSE